MPNVIYSTGKCFNDACEFLNGVLDDPNFQTMVKLGPADVDHGTFRICHGICVASDHVHGHLRPGQHFAHAWVEVRGEVWQAGLLNGQKIWCSYERASFYREMQPLELTRYTPREAIRLNAKHRSYGPWLRRYERLCKPKGSYATQ